MHCKNYHFLLLKSIFKKLPVKDPAIKLIPAMKLIGSLTDSHTIRSTLILFELFCIPTIKRIKNEELRIIEKINFLKSKNMFFEFLRQREREQILILQDCYTFNGSWW